MSGSLEGYGRNDAIGFLCRGKAVGGYDSYGKASARRIYGWRTLYLYIPYDNDRVVLNSHFTAMMMTAR